MFIEKLFITLIIFSEEEPPEVLLKLHNIADQECGWIQVVQSMVNVIPVEDPLGPAVITLLLDDCPLPNKVNNSLYFILTTLK